VADSKIEFKLASITFSGEGDGGWLSEQLDKVLTKLPDLIALAQQEDQKNGGNNGGNSPGGSGPQTVQASVTLAAYLKLTVTTKNQVRKFLATAVWLHDAEKKQRLTTGEVNLALNKHNQGKLNNAANQLSQNITKGFCVKDGKTFYVTPDGRTSLGK